jgi:V/A-type H+-transporting ATPase subunit I
MITRMAKVEIVGPRRFLLATVDALQGFGRLHVASTHVSDFPAATRIEEPVADPGQLRYRARLEELLRKVEEVLSLLNEVPALRPDRRIPSPETITPSDLTGEMVDQKLELCRQIQERVRAMVQRKLDLKDELQSVSRYRHVIEAFAPMMGKLSAVGGLDVIGFTFRKKRQEVLEILRRELGAITANRFEIFTRELDQETLAGVAAVPRALHREVKRLFVSENVSELRLPEQMGDRPPLEVLSLLSRRLEEIPAEIHRLDEEMGLLAEDHYPERFQRLRQALEDRIAEFSAMGFAARTRMTFILIGWLPEGEWEEFTRFARENLDPSLLINRVSLSHHDLASGRIPVIIRNPPLIRPFELCLRLLPRPTYAGVDPTPFLAVFFPLFFGLILGDVAYGLILLGAALFIHYRYRSYALANSVSIILFACATSSILFGVLFGEFLGDLGHRAGWMKPILLNREEAIIPSLVLAVSMGVAHILLGIAIKAYTSFRWHHYGHGIEALATLALLVTLGILLAELLGYLPRGFRSAGIGAVVVLVPILIASGGIVAVLEIFGTIGNILSYARIMAIGLSSVILAVVANRLAGQFGSAVLGTAIAVLVHLINLILGVFGPTVHGLRLHYVEFFSKFYRTGSVEYKPLARKGSEETPALKGGM